MVSKGLESVSISEAQIRKVVSGWADEKVFRDKRLSSRMRLDRIESGYVGRVTLRSYAQIISEGVRLLPGKAPAPWNHTQNMVVPVDREATFEKVISFDTKTCPKCEGKKRLPCGTCKAEGQVRCGGCGGRGQVLVTKQEWHNTTYNDPWDGGIRYKSEMVSKQVLETCPGCHGSGTVRCHNCGGRRYFDCEKCETTGIVTSAQIYAINYRFIEATTYRDRDGIEVSESFLQEDALYQKSVYERREQGMMMGIDSEECPIKFNLDALQTLSRKTKPTTDVEGNPKSVDLFWQEVEAMVTPVHRVVYSYGNKTDLPLCVYGEDQRLYLPDEHKDSGRMALAAIATVAAVVGALGVGSVIVTQNKSGQNKQAVQQANPPAATPVASDISTRPVDQPVIVTPKPDDTHDDVPDSSVDVTKMDHLYTQEEVDDMDFATVQKTINELFARYGYVLQTDAELQEYFENDTNWYKARPGVGEKAIMEEITSNKQDAKQFNLFCKRRDALKAEIYEDLKVAIRGASEAEGKAKREGDVSLLENYVAGDLYDRLNKDIEDNKNKGEYEDNSLVSQRFDQASLRIWNSGSEASVHLMETWHDRRCEKQTGSIVFEKPDKDVPQTLTLKKIEGKWLVVSVRFDK